jgi:hypothetical protein
VRARPAWGTSGHLLCGREAPHQYVEHSHVLMQACKLPQCWHRAATPQRVMSRCRGSGACCCASPGAPAVLPVAVPARAGRARGGAAGRPAGNMNRRLAALDNVILQIKIHFRLNTLNNCKSLINSTRSPSFLAFDRFPAAQRVTFRYYVGRLAIFDENYVRRRARISPLRGADYIE